MAVTMTITTLTSGIGKFLKEIAQNTHKEGYKQIAIFLIVTTVLGIYSKYFLFIGLIISGWCIYFFRNPKRFQPTPNAIVSCADGIVTDVSTQKPPKELGFDANIEMIRVSTFLSVFDVHVNRVPFKCIVDKIVYHKGKFLNASLDKSSVDNERNSLKLSIISEDGTKLFDAAVVQIAGLIARRIVCSVKESQKLESGEEFGLIKFGSRVDVYLPLETKILVTKGQRMVGGETIISLL